MAESESNNANDSRCFPAILRRLLCSDSLRTHPSDHITELQISEFKNRVEEYSKPKIQAPATPGIVARLMGLESLPDSHRIPKAYPDSFTRSRSVNFMDYLLELDLTQTQHRRVRTSVSFREVPAFLGQPKQEVFVFHLDNNVDRIEIDKLEKKQRKPEMKIRPLKQRNEETSKVKHKKDEERRKKLDSRRNDVYRRKQSSNPKVKIPLKQTIQKEAVDELELTKKKRSQQRPVNKKVKHDETPPSAKRHNPEKQTIKKREGKAISSEPDSAIELMKKLCRLTEKDVGEQKWMLVKSNVFESDDFEEISIVFGNKIFDQLLQQIIDELDAVEI